MRVVVTGGTGNIGAALVSRLPGNVTGIARHPPPGELTGPHLTWHRCDIGAPDALGRLTALFAGADAVVHLAWAINPPAGDAPMDRTNLTGSANVLDAVAASGVAHLVCASSVAAYADAPRGVRVDERWPVGGIRGSAYSRQKAALEAMLDRFENEHPEITVARIRPCGIVPPAAGARMAGWLLSPLLPPSLFGRPVLPIPTWPGMRFQLVDVDDVAAAIELILAGRVGGAYNLAGEPVLHHADLAGAGVRHVVLPYPVLLGGAAVTWRAGLQPLHPGWLRLADRAAVVATDAARSLGWQPRVLAGEALRRLAEAIRGASRPDAGVRLGRALRQSQG